MPRNDLDRQISVVQNELSQYANVVDELFDRVIATLKTLDPYDAKIVMQREDDLEKSAESIEEKLVDIMTLQQPIVGRDLRFIVALLVINQRMQRVSHGAIGAARLANDLVTQFSSVAQTPPALIDLGESARTLLALTMKKCATNAMQSIQDVIAGEQLVDSKNRAVREQLLEEMKSFDTTTAAGADETRRVTYWLWLAHRFERAADHAMAIARRAHTI